MKTEENQAQREMTLSEVVDNLPVSHSARSTFAAIETAMAVKDEALCELIAADFQYDVSPKNDRESESRRIEAIKAAGVAISDHIPDATKKVLMANDKEAHHPGCFPDGDDTFACHPDCPVRKAKEIDGSRDRLTTISLTPTKWLRRQDEDRD